MTTLVPQGWAAFGASFTAITLAELGDKTNNMVGPEISLLLESTHGRWTFASEFKFTAAFNWQNNLYRGANFPDSLAADYLRTTFSPSVTQTAGGTTEPIAINPPPPAPMPPALPTPPASPPTLNGYWLLS